MVMAKAYLRVTRKHPRGTKRRQSKDMRMRSSALASCAARAKVRLRAAKMQPNGSKKQQIKAMARLKER